MRATTELVRTAVLPHAGAGCVGACEAARREGLGTNHVSVFYHTSEHDCAAPMRSDSTTVTLPEATNDTLALIKAALLRGGDLARAWRPAVAVQQGRDRYH